MTPSFTVSVLWLLGMTGAAAILSRQCSRQPAALCTMAAGYGVTMPLSLLLSPQPNWVGLCLGLAAIWGPLGGGDGVRLPPLAGVMAGLAAALEMAGGVAWWLAVGLGVISLISAAALLQGGGYRANRWSDRVLLLAAVGAPVIGLASDAVYGWQSAVVLNRTEPSATATVPGWALGFVVAALAAGVVWGMRKTR